MAALLKLTWALTLLHLAMTAQLPSINHVMTVVDTTSYLASNSTSSLAFFLPDCLQAQEPTADELMIVVMASGAVPAALEMNSEFPAGAYAVDRFALPACTVGTGSRSVYRLGTLPMGTACTQPPQPPASSAVCNPNLASGTDYSVNGILYSAGAQLSQLGWSPLAKTVTSRVSRENLVLPPQGRSGGMVVITVILTVLMAILIVLLIAAVVSGTK